MVKRITPFLALLLTLLPIVVYWLCWGHLAVNVPKWDDHALKAYLFYSEQETTFTGKIYQLFRQHNEHRIVLDRFVTLLDFSLFGKLNYLHLMILGNASLLGLLAIFGKTLKDWGLGISDFGFLPATAIDPKSEIRNPQSIVYLPPIAFLLFNLSSWENAFWGMAALQNFSVVLFVIWAIYVLSYTQNLAGAVVLALLATLTSGNGILIWPIGAVLLALQRRFRPLIFWGISAAIIIGLYFVGYEKPAGNPPDRGSLLDLLKGWLAFSGAAGEVLPIGNAFTVCLIFGGGMTGGLLVSAVWMLAKQIRTAMAVVRGSPPGHSDRSQSAIRNPQSAIQNLLLGSLAFLLGTAAIVAWSRVGFGLDVLITSRYKIYSLTLLCVGYVFAVTQLNGRWRQLAGVVGLVGSMTIAGLSYLTYADEVIWWRRWLLTNQYNWTYLSNSPVSGIDPTTARWVDNAPAYYDRCLVSIYKSIKRDMMTLALDKVYQSGGQFVIQSHSAGIHGAVQPSLFCPDDGLTLMVQSDKRTYLYGALPTPANNAYKSLRRGLYPTRDLLTMFPANEPEPGLYRLTLLQYEEIHGVCAIYPTAQTLLVKPQPGTDLKKNW